MSPAPAASASSASGAFAAPTPVRRRAAALGAALTGALLLAGAALAAGTPATGRGAVERPFAKSFEGTSPLGTVALDERGELVVDAALRDFFEYYMAAVGERSVDEIRREIERQIGLRLKPAQATKAREVFGRYFGYKVALIEVEKTLAQNGASTARARFEAMQRAREQYFSDSEREAFFGDGDAYDRDALARQEIMEDSGLTAAERQARLAELDASLPEALRVARDEVSRLARVEETVARLRAEGAGDSEVFRLRAENFSTEAALRMAEVDREEAEWKTRIDTYREARRKLLDSNTLAEAERGREIQKLRQKLFSPQEQKRLTAYEQ